MLIIIIFQIQCLTLIYSEEHMHGKIPSLNLLEKSITNSVFRNLCRLRQPMDTTKVNRYFYLITHKML